MIGVGLFVVAGLVVLRFTVYDDNATALRLEQVQHRYRDDIQRSSTSTSTTDAPSPTATTPTTQVRAEAPSPTSMTTTTAGVATTHARSTLMAPGVYRYATTGQESVDALGGTSHEYPPETTITVTPDGCGVLLRWDVLAQRRDEWRLCAAADGIELEPTGLQYHEFFAQPDSENIVCDRAIVIVPVDDVLPPPAALNCTLAADVWLPTWSVLGREQRTVEGAVVDVVHVRMTVDDGDQYFEHTTIDWYFDSNGLPIEVNGTKTSSSSSPIGAVLYKEQFGMQIESLQPLQ